PDLDHTYESLDERLTRLERGTSRPSSPSPAQVAPSLRPIGASVQGVAPLAGTPTTKEPTSANESTPEAAPIAPPAGDADRSSVGAISLDEFRERFAERVVPRISRSAQLLLRSARVEALEGLLLTIAVASEEMRQNTELIAQGLKGALEHEFKMALTIQWTVDPALETAPTPARRAPARSLLVEEEYIEIDDVGVVDDVVVVDSVASHLITEMFPGAEEIS
ncbi:MAG: hypothetical protein WCA31_01980, partial [Acidimicrobiales bacterium]